MSMAKTPFVSVVTVNFNGERYLEGLLRSLERQTYPSFEILVVDNGSTDGSLALLQRSFPGVRRIEAGRNLGFTGGNNLGIREAKGAFVALLNNDTLVEPTWLSSLVGAAQIDPTIGGVGSKIVFARPYLPVTLERLGEASGWGVLVAQRSSFEPCAYDKPIFQSDFSGPQEMEGETARRMERRATVFLPVESLADPGSLHLRARAEAADGPSELGVAIDGNCLGVLQLGSTWQDYHLPLSAGVSRRVGFDVINNAGSFLRDDGVAGDRGIYEPDRGQYDAAEDVTALCGCSMLLRRSVLDTVGLFDRDFFMYYEDTELSWRIRKAGFRLRFVPESVVRHFHASTSVEWSPLFNFLVARNRILMLIKHAAPRVVLRAYGEEIARLLRLVRIRRPWAEPVRTRLRIQASLLWRAPRAGLKRIGLLPH